MTSRIRIKLGAIEIEYEGSEQFLKKELPDLLSAVSKLYQESDLKKKLELSSEIPENDVKRPILQLTTGNIATKIGCKSGLQLALAAATHLTLSKNTNTFSRQQILNEMKTATNYYKETYRKNLTNILRKLLKDEKLIESSKDVYALKAEACKSMEAVLAK